VLSVTAWHGVAESAGRGRYARLWTDRLPTASAGAISLARDCAACGLMLKRRDAQGVKFLIGLAGRLAAGWIAMGRSARCSCTLDATCRRCWPCRAAGRAARMEREPLARKAILAGPADQFQREGMGSLPGIDERVLAITGMGGLEWAN
jgi:hypothetical protein